MRQHLRRLSVLQHGAFTTQQALSCYTAEEIRARVHSGAWVRLHRGVMCSATVVDLDCRIAAAGLALGARAVVCLHTAATLHGFGVEDDRIHVVDPGRHVNCRDGLVVHQLSVPAAEQVLVRGWPATSPARTAVELARGERRPRALAVLDAALHTGVMRPADLESECLRQAGRRGIVQVRELVKLADGRAESPMESITRLLCVDAGLPPPTPQFEVVAGWERRRIDLAWPDYKVALEYEGERFHSGAVALRRDRARHNWLAERGWTIIYATADDVLRHPERLLRQLRTALTRAA